MKFCWHSYIKHKKYLGKTELKDVAPVVGLTVCSVLLAMLVFGSLVGAMPFRPSLACFSWAVLRSAFGVVAAVGSVSGIILIIGWFISYLNGAHDTPYFDKSCEKCGKHSFAATKKEMTDKAIEDKKISKEELTLSYRKKVKMFKKGIK